MRLYSLEFPFPPNGKAWVKIFPDKYLINKWEMFQFPTNGNARGTRGARNDQKGLRLLTFQPYSNGNAQGNISEKLTFFQYPSEFQFPSNGKAHR